MKIRLWVLRLFRIFKEPRGTNSKANPIKYRILRINQPRDCVGTIKDVVRGGLTYHNIRAQFRICSHNTEMGTRLAAETDFQAMLDVSEGLYDGLDYLPCVFIQWLRDVNRLVIVAENEGRVIGLTVVHAVDQGKTVVHEALRIHPEYRGRNLATKLLQATRQYVDKHFPSVEIERGVTVKLFGKGGTAVTKKSSFSPNLEFPSLAIVVRVSSSQLAITPPKDLTTDIFNGNSLTNKEFKDLIEGGNLNEIEPENTLFINGHPYEIHPSNISKGLLQAQDYIFAFTDPETKAIQSLSHGRMFRNWTSIVYVSDPKQLNLHISQQLEAAILQSDGKTFLFQCLFEKESLLPSAKKFMQEALSCEELDIMSDVAIVYQKDY